MLLRMVAVHFCNRSGRGQAALFVTESAARDMVEAGLAIWSKKATYINLTKTEASLVPPQRSCRMGPEVIHGCCEGDVNDMALRDAWRPLAA